MVKIYVRNGGQGISIALIVQSLDPTLQLHPGTSKSLHDPKYSDAQDNEHRQIEEDGEAHSPTLIWTDLLTGEGESPKLPERVEIKREKRKEN